VKPAAFIRSSTLTGVGIALAEELPRHVEDFCFPVPLALSWSTAWPKSLAAARVLRTFDDDRHRAANLHDAVDIVSAVRPTRGVENVLKRIAIRFAHRSSAALVQLDLRSGFCAQIR